MSILIKNYIYMKVLLPQYQHTGFHTENLIFLKLKYQRKSISILYK